MKKRILICLAIAIGISIGTCYADGPECKTYGFTYGTNHHRIHFSCNSGLGTVRTETNGKMWPEVYIFFWDAQMPYVVVAKLANFVMGEGLLLHKETGIILIQENVGDVFIDKEKGK